VILPRPDSLAPRRRNDPRAVRYPAAMGFLAGRNALVVGVATRHSIAWAVAAQLHEHGARVGIVHRRPETARRVAPLVRAIDAPFAMACDVRDDAAIAAVVERARSAFDGRLDILVHAVANAPAGALAGRFTDTTRPDFQAALDVSAYSLIALTRAAEPLLRPGASVVTLTAIASRRVFPGYNVMGIAKAALEASVRHLAYDLGPAGIRVNAVSAGAVRTVAAMGVPGFRALYRQGAARAPLRRGLSAADVAAAVVWLASDSSAAVTGQVIEVDAGWSILGLSGEPEAS
jgi:enoyl-[acyl-carrier protein] reductase I